MADPFSPAGRFDERRRLADQHRPLKPMTAPEPASDTLVDRLRAAAAQTSATLRSMAEAKSLRQSDNPEGSADLYEWPTPDQTLEGQAADRIEALSRQSGEVSEAMVEAGVKACNGTLSTFRVAAIYRAMQEARDD